MTISRSLQTIVESLERLAPLLTAAEGNVLPGQGAGKAVRPKRKLTLTPARSKALKVQGQYLGLLRGLGQRDRARVTAIAKEQGVAAAVTLGRKLAGR
jgi:hypothetical protein